MEDMKEMQEMNLEEMDEVNGGATFVDGAIHFYKRVTKWTKDVAIPACEDAAKATGKFCSGAASAAKNLGTAAFNWVKSLF